jgi:hypothetical protein
MKKWKGSLLADFHEASEALAETPLGEFGDHRRFPWQ